MWINIKDQTGAKITLPTVPHKILSCVPSLTETIIECGHLRKLTGRTKFCIHPSNVVKSIPIIGGTKTLHIEKIKSLNPHLIIANKEENTKSDILALKDYFPVYISDIKDLNDLRSFGRDMEKIFGNDCDDFVNKLEEQQTSIFQPSKLSTVAYLIWRNPYMAVGADTFIDHMLKVAGFKNVFNDRKRYPEVTLDELQAKSPDFIFLSSEPFPFKEKHIEELNVVLIKSRIILVDGEMFSWYGTRTLTAFDYFEKLRTLLRIA